MKLPTTQEMRDIAIAKICNMSHTELVNFLVKDIKFVAQYLEHKREGFNGPQPFRN
jgi:hypothetical protein